jgi:uncharacterized membrane protein YkvA (DUF1232 family)
MKREVVALWLVARHPGTPWYVKLLALAVTAYALSPIDLIPDFVPVLGYLDDLVIVPLGAALVLRLTPPAVLAECRARAATLAERPTSRAGLLIMVAIWLAAALLLVRAFWPRLAGG